MNNFEEFGLSKAVMKSIVTLGYDEPTPIQRDGIPIVLQGHDIIGLAQTGTGKTAAFGLPLVHHLLKDDSPSKPRAVGALIVAPTRELVKQIGENLRLFTQRTPLRVNMVVGGASIHFQKKKLEKGTDILVATPGRLMDLVERKAVYLDSARYLVLDEADQMLDLGFIHVLRKIAKLVGRPRQTLLFSATMPKQIAELAKAFLENPVRIEVSRSGKAADKITQSVHFVGQGDKSSLLRDCLIKDQNALSLVFARTKHGAEKLMKLLVSWGFSANSIHGNKSQGQRERAIRAFKEGETRILVATDVAARGIDIPGVSHVYNYDLPDVPENYVHRIGRTARAGREGEAIAFCSPSELHLLGNIEKLMALDIDVASGERAQFTNSKGRKNNSRGRSRKPQNGRGKNPQSEARSARGFGNGASKSRSGNRNRDENRGQNKRPDRKFGAERSYEIADSSNIHGRDDVATTRQDKKGYGEQKFDSRQKSNNKSKNRPKSEEAKTQNRGGGKKRRFGAGDQQFSTNDAENPSARFDGAKPKRANGKIRSRAGKKRGKKKPAIA